jgi:hypothetical protein
MKFPSFIFCVSLAASVLGDSLPEPSGRLDSIIQPAVRGDSLAAAVGLGDSSIQPTRVPQYEPVYRETEGASSKDVNDMSFALALNLGRLATYGVRLDYGIRREKSRLSAIGSFGIGYTGKTRVMRMTGGLGVCFSQTFLRIGRIFALASGCGLGFWTIRDYCPEPVFESYDGLNAAPAKETGYFVQNEWFLLNTRAEFTMGTIRFFVNADLLMSPRRFTPSLGAGMVLPLGGGDGAAGGGLRHDNS